LEFYRIAISKTREVGKLLGSQVLEFYCIAIPNTREVGELLGWCVVRTLFHATDKRLQTYNFGSV